MEREAFKKLKILVEVLTHSGSNTLDDKSFKELKNLCKSSQDNISAVYSLLLTELKKKNSQIRLAAFQICKELFTRSCLFRENVIRDLNMIFDLTTEMNSKKLPPPKSSAESLKSLVISTLKEWVEKFGKVHKKLKLAYKYFEKCKQVDFQTLQSQSSAEQVLENEQQRHIRMVNEEKTKKILEEFKSNESEIETTATSLSNCLSLLLPPVEDFFIPEHNLPKINSSVKLNNVGQSTDQISNNPTDDNAIVQDENGDDQNHFMPYQNDLRECGIPNNYNLSLQLDFNDKFKVVKTEENSSIIENAKDSVRLINNRFLPMIKKWIKVLCKCSDRNGNNIKIILDVKEKLENILKKYNAIMIDENCPNSHHESDSDEDDDFEEVKKEGYEEGVDLSEELLLDCLSKRSVTGNSNSVASSSLKSSRESGADIPTASTSNSEPGPSSSSKPNSQPLDRKKKLLSIAPKLPYDIDLYHWEDENLSTPTLISTKIDVDKFWGSAGSDDIHEIPNPDGVAALRTRVIEFSGTFEPVKWTCRAPLPSGKLCPRKDRFKCPFHGKIVPRDAMGNPQDKDGSTSTAQGTDQSAQDFQNPEFLNDLKAATGLDLTIPKKGGKKRKSGNKNLTHKKMKTSAGALKILESKNLPGLVDVVKRQNNAYTRLSKKVFNKSSLRRVSAVLNKLERNKFRDKFGDQFNYS